MSVCPVPASASVTDYSAPGSFTSSPPDAKFELCEGGTTSVITGPGTIVTQTICCPSPGPAGPAGCSLLYKGAWTTGTVYYANGNIPCETDLVTHNGGVYITKVTHTADSSTEPGVGASWATDWDAFTTDATDRMKWTGDWTIGVDYKENDVVRYNGDAYVCFADHTGDATKIPSQTETTYWNAATDVTQGITPENLSFLDSLTSSVLDWVDSAISNGDWLQLLAAGVGVAVAGAAIVDMFIGDGSGDGQADSRFTGTAGFNGAVIDTNLQTVVSSIMSYAGKAPTDYDVSALPITPVNFTIANTMTLGSLLSNLALAYQFDIVPSGGVVKFIPKYIASVRTLTLEDMGHDVISGTDITGPAPYTAKRLQGIDLPRSVTLTYYSSDLDYNTFSQTSTLETYVEGQDVKLDVPMTLSDANAKQIAESSLINAHIERQSFTFITDIWNIDLEPSDVITIPLDTGGTMDVRILQISSQTDGLIEITAARADNNSTTWSASTIASGVPPEQTTNIITTIGYSSALFFEAPPLSDSDTSPRYFAAVHGYAAPGWPGATVYRSTDGGASYSQVVTTSSIVTMGKMNSITPAPLDYHIWDDNTVLTVLLKQGSLISATSDLAVQNGQNWCMVGEEVIGFRDAVLVGANTYQLSRLLRGRQGTEQKCGDHTADELFVILDSALTQINIDATSLNKTVKYKVVTVGSDIGKVNAIDVKPYGLNMRPWAVAQPKAVRGIPTTNDWKITWIERPRYQNQMRDYTEITHDADWAGYAIAIKDGVNIKRTATCISPDFVYTEAMQITDFGSIQTTIDCSIVQMSTIVGGGYPYIVTA